jgi:hypothetical protein
MTESTKRSAAGRMIENAAESKIGTNLRRAQPQAGGSASESSNSETGFARGCMTNLGTLQTIAAWAEDRALLRSTPSTDPGAKTGARAERNCLALCSHTNARQLRDWHHRDKPSRHEAATSGTGCHLLPLSNANRAKFHFTVNQDSQNSDLWHQRRPLTKPVRRNSLEPRAKIN